MKDKDAPRVDENNNLNQPTMSAQPTSPGIIQQTPLIHQRQMQNNKPAFIPLDDDTNLIPPPRRKSSRIHARLPNYLSQDALNSILMLS